jgi:hypothetical protein
VSALFEPLDDQMPATRISGTQVMEKVEAKAPVPSEAMPPVTDPERPKPRPRRPIHIAPPRPKAPSTIMVVGLVILVAILAYLIAS